MKPSFDKPAPVDWQDGWYLPARRRESPNFGARPSSAIIDLAVIHSISLPPGIYGGNQVLDFFGNALDWNAHPYFKAMEGLQVSAHFYIQRSGLLWQCVSCDQRAWHAGASSYRGRANCNDDSIGIELEGLEGDSFEPEQYQTLQDLLTAIAAQYPLAFIAGHEHIAPGRKKDPGPGFDWAHLRRCVALKSQCFPDGADSK